MQHIFKGAARRGTRTKQHYEEEHGNFVWTKFFIDMAKNMFAYVCVLLRWYAPTKKF